MESNEVKQTEVSEGESDFLLELDAMCKRYGIKQYFFGGINVTHEEVKNAGDDTENEFYAQIIACPAFILQAVPEVLSDLPARHQIMVANELLLRARSNSIHRKTTNATA